jgi:hypothetical protein
MARKYPLEQLFSPLFRGLPRTLTGDFAGRTTISEGSLSVPVAATAAESDSIISLAVETGVDSLVCALVVVQSINPGVGMVIGPATGIAIGGDVTVMWRIIGQ